MHLQRAAEWVGRTSAERALVDWRKVHWLIRDQPRSERINHLRSRACGKVLSFGRRVGLAPDEAVQYAEEALSFARDAGDRNREMILLCVYGRFEAVTGS